MSASSSHNYSNKMKDPYPEEKERFSLSTSMVPTLPAYGYTSKDLRLVDRSNAGAGDRLSTEYDWEEQTLCASSLTPIQKTGTAGLPPR